MTNFLKNLFKSSSFDKKNDPNANLRDQISSAIIKCKEERDIEYERINEIKKWGKDLIFEIFDVPSAYWYDEINEYENIKYHENNIKVSERLVQKTDMVIEEYREQLKLNESKVDFCDALIKEYERILLRLDETIKNIEKLNKEENQLKLLSKHKKRLEDMRTGTANFDEMYGNSGELEILNEDIQNIEEDFKIKNEVSDYIENLDREFSENVENTDSLSLRDEIKKLTEKIKK